MIQEYTDDNGEIRTGVFMRTPHNYDMEEASLASSLLCEDPTLTQQNSIKECDINHIVERFNLTGQLPENLGAPLSGDFTAVTDYHTALNAIRKAEEAFMQMPAEIRDEFHNDPGEFVAFCDDEKNRERAEKLGLVLARPAPPEPPLVRVLRDPEETPSK